MAGMHRAHNWTLLKEEKKRLDKKELVPGNDQRRPGYAGDIAKFYAVGDGEFLGHEAQGLSIIVARFHHAFETLKFIKPEK